MKKLAIALTFLLAVAPPAQAEVIKIDYSGFTVWVDCDRRGPILFHYIADKDRGNFGRHSSYDIDTAVPADCQATSTETFQSVITVPGVTYDVGHQVPANHFDGSAQAIRETNFWTNLLPQTSSMNRGAWLETEHIIECLREEVSLEVWGGPIWGSNLDDDYFVDSHGVQTPAAFWKVVIRTDNRQTIAWIIPNGRASARSLDRWLHPLATIELVTGREFNAVNKQERLEHSWRRSDDCDIS